MAVQSLNQIAQAINLALKGGGSSKDVVGFLSRRKLLSKSGEILEKLEKIVDEERGVLKGSIWSSAPIPAKNKNDILAFLAKKYKGKKIILEEYIDDSLKGGWKIEIGGEMIDSSIKTKLKKLQDHLKKNYV